MLNGWALAGQRREEKRRRLSLTMAIEIIPAHEIPLADQARVFTESFEGYVGGSFTMDAGALARFICAQGADLCHSRFARNAAGLCGFAYITRTGRIARLAGMGVVLAARRAGVARQLLRHLLEEAKQRCDCMMMLEVIEQNPAAHALYRSENFREIARLFSWRRPANAPPSSSVPQPAANLDEVSLLAASQGLSGLEFPELPWQISRHAVAKLLNARAYSTGRATVVIDDPDGGTGPIRTHAFFSRESERMNWPEMRTAFSAVIQAHPGREFFAPAIFPEEFGREIFAPLGFQPDPLRQFLMRRDF